MLQKFGDGLINGLKVVLANEKQQNILSELNELCLKNNVNIIQTTPSRFNLLLKEGASFLKNISILIVGGEPLTEKLIKIFKNFPNIKVYNVYGPTETAVWSTIKYNPNVDEITIGSPISNTQVFILDKKLRLLPINTPGELYIGGDGVSNGYFNKKDLTETSFIRNSFINDIIYKTNDLAYMKPDGELVHLGRNDFQVKLHGFRVELGEIENVLLSYPDMEEAIMVIMEDDLVAFYTSNNTFDNADLYDFMLKKLPYYMMPKTFQKIKTMPLTPNGKIDRESLLQINIKTEKKSNVQPRNSTDEFIVNTLMKLLNIKEISVTDSVIEIGVDSLIAINLIIEINDCLHTTMSIKDVFSNPIISNLSDYINNNIVSLKSDNITKTKENKYYPVSSAQKRIYYSSEIDKENSLLYNIAGGIILEEAPDVKKFEECLKKLFYRHESLRTYFELIDGNIVQKIEESINFKLDIGNGKFSEINEITKKFIKPFYLNEAPLFRTKLVKLDNNKCLVLLNIHHIISDGTSLSILFKEICELYNNNQLKEKAIDYKDFAVWENKKINSDEYIESEKYWISQFEDEIPLLNLPTTYPRNNTRSFEGASIGMEIDGFITKKINEVSKKLGVTPYMLLLSVYYILLYKYTEQEDIIVGTPVACRDATEISDVIGMFVNTLALRSNINSSVQFSEYVDNIKEMCINSFAHQTYPFDELINKLNIKRVSDRTPLFETMFVYQNEGYPTIDLNGIKGEIYTADSNIAKFDLSLEIIPKNNMLNLRFEYGTKLFDSNYIERLSKHYINILKSVLENIDIQISKIDMLSIEEKNQILYEFNNTDFEYDKNKSLIEIFEEQVNKNPNKTAVIFENQEISYRELNNRANQIANDLINRNIKRNNVVSIMLNRSIETIICMLGILKSSATYMLIDYNLPSDRILYMLENSGSKLLITNNNIKKIDFNNQLYIDDEYLEKHSKNNLNLYNSNEDGFCIIYTSGSTGKPKGVELTKKGVINMLASYKKFLYTDKCNRFLSMSAVSFDMFIVENFIPLLSGATVVLTNEEEQKIPIFINKLIKEKNIDFVLTTPSRMELLLATLEDKSDWKSMKVIQLGGEVFGSALYNSLRKHTSVHIFNGYGPTEMTACCSNKEVVYNNELPTIGIPFCNTKMLICDKDMNLCPIGIAGEICASGDGIANGYINNKEMTNNSFIPNPFGNGLIYKTGDIGKFNSNGEIEYIGRKDFQVKIRGLRVELSEIEKQLLLIQDIKNASVIYNKTDNDEYIVGYFIAEKQLDIVNVRNELSKYLPLYMVPKYIMQLDSFPITTNGKINKSELLKYNISLSNSQNYVEPETEIQEILCNTWEKLLHTKVGIDDNVFELGADSLIAINLKTELLIQNINIPYADIFKYTTVRELTEILNGDSSETIKSEDFDYLNINNILSKNIIENINKEHIAKCTNNNILLLGANGFVGSHILYSFIKNDTGVAYCIIREKNNKSAYNRIIDTLHFYFGDELDKEIDKRIFIIQANITEKYFGLSENKYNEIVNNSSIVLNTAAIVKHYGNDSKFKLINIDLTQNIVDFCLKHNKMLIHISTTSVSGNVSNKRDYANSSKNLSFSESNLYIGQELDNIYTKTKFKAEKIILENIHSGLNAKILRLGNITNRYSDGKFQINPEENAFLNRLRTFINMGCMPNSLAPINLEFTPVDICADAIVHVMQNNLKDFSVFHLYNDNYIIMNELYDILNERNMKIEYLSDEDFILKVREILSDEDRKDILIGIINDIDNKRNLNYSSNIDLKSEFTKSFLHISGFEWPNIEDEYIEKYIKYFIKIKYI